MTASAAGLCVFCGEADWADGPHDNAICRYCGCAQRTRYGTYDYKTRDYFYGNEEGGVEGGGYADYTRHRYLRNLQGKLILSKFNELLGRGFIEESAPGKVVEVGAALGYMMEPFLQRGWACMAVEPNLLAQEYMQVYEVTAEIIKKGSWTTIGRLPNAAEYPLWRGNTDALICFDVLEHLPDLPQDLLNLGSICRPGAVFMAQVPDFSLYKDKPDHRHWAVGQHLWHGTAEGWTRILRKHGFRILETEKAALVGSPYADVESVVMWGVKE